MLKNSEFIISKLNSTILIIKKRICLQYREHNITKFTMEDKNHIRYQNLITQLYIYAINNIV